MIFLAANQYKIYVSKVSTYNIEHLYNKEFTFEKNIKYFQRKTDYNWKKNVDFKSPNIILVFH